MIGSWPKLIVDENGEMKPNEKVPSDWFTTNNKNINMNPIRNPSRIPNDININRTRLRYKMNPARIH